MEGDPAHLVGAASSGGDDVGRQVHLSHLEELYRNISATLRSMERTQRVALEEHRRQIGLQKTGETGDGGGVDGVASLSDEVHYNDSENAWLYILFVLMFYAFSIVVLMVKYIRREREGSKLEYYYNEFVKRDWYKDKNLYDSCGRRIRYNVDGNTVTRLDVEDRNKRRRTSYYEDPDDYLFSEDEEEEGHAGEANGATGGTEDDDDSGGSVETTSKIAVSTARSSKSLLKKGGGARGDRRSVMLCVGAASIFAESAALGLATIKNNKGATEETKEKVSVEAEAETSLSTLQVNLGARPKRSSLRNWPPPPPPDPQDGSLHRPLSSSASAPAHKRPTTSKKSRHHSATTRDKDGRKESDEYEPVPLAFLQSGRPGSLMAGCSRLTLAKVDRLDEKVRRARSMPAQQSRAQGGRAGQQGRNSSSSNWATQSVKLARREYLSFGGRTRRGSSLDGGGGESTAESTPRAQHKARTEGGEGGGSTASSHLSVQII